MSTLSRKLAGVCLAFGLSILWSGLSAETAAGAPAVDPVAVQKLEQATGFLAGLPQFSVSTQNVIEELQFSGHRVDYDLSSRVIIRRPDRLHAARAGGSRDQHLFYDGKSLTLYDPKERAYATESAPGTIEGMIELAREKIGILLPAADLLYRNAFPLLMQDVTLAAVVGKADVGGISCDHLLFSRPEVDFQLWIAEGDQPWVLKYVVTETGTPERLSITTVFSEWDSSPVADDSQFEFVPPAGAQVIKFMPYRPADVSGR
jgi:hypothetical protein